MDTHTRDDGARAARRGRARERVAFALQLAGFLGVTLAARASLADHYHVPSGSMEPTIRVGDRLLVDKRAYGLRVPGTHVWLTAREPARGDVVVFDAPTQDLVLVKRLVGLPGDRVAFDGQTLRINGAVVAQRTAAGGARIERLGGRDHPVFAGPDQGPAYGERVVPPGYYFVMGDHRGDSADSRFWGFVPRANLLGRAVAVLYSGARDLPLGQRFWLSLADVDASGHGDPRLAR
jgi:signal peptidase I